MATDDDDQTVNLQASVPFVATPSVEPRVKEPTNKILAWLSIVGRVIAGIAIVATLMTVTFGSLGLGFWSDRSLAPYWSRAPDKATPESEPVATVTTSETAPLPPGSECNQPLVLQRMSVLMQNLSFESSANIGQIFLDKCDRDTEIGFATMESWYRVSQFEKSLAVLDQFPEEARYYSDLATWEL